MTNDDVLIRPAAEEDRAFIIDSWLRSYRDSAFACRIPSDVYWSRWGHAGYVEDKVSDASGLLVACLPSDPAFLYGFAAMCVSPAPGSLKVALAYLYVKRDFRRNGIAARLALAMDAAVHVPPMHVTHDTPAWRAFAAKHGIKFEYVHPYPKERK